MLIFLPLPPTNAEFRVRASGPALCLGSVHWTDRPIELDAAVQVLHRTSDFLASSHRYVRLVLPLAGEYVLEAGIRPSSLHGAVTAPRRPVPMLPYCSPEPYRTLVSYRAGNTSARINPITRCDAIGSWRGTSSGHVLVRMCHGYLIALPTLQRPLLLLSISRKGAQSFLAICFFAAGGASNLARAVRTCFRRCCNTVSSRSWS